MDQIFFIKIKVVNKNCLLC